MAGAQVLNTAPDEAASEQQAQADRPFQQTRTHFGLYLRVEVSMYIFGVLHGCIALSVPRQVDVVCVEHTTSARAAAARVNKVITPDQELYTSLKEHMGGNNAQRVKLLWLASLKDKRRLDAHRWHNTCSRITLYTD